RSRLCRDRVETSGERLRRIVAEHKSYDPARATFLHRPALLDNFVIVHARQGADAIGPSPFRAPVRSGGGAVSDFGSSWTLAARGMDFLSSAPFGPQLVPVLTSQRPR